MKTLAKIALLSIAALTIAGAAQAETRDYRSTLANQDKFGHPVYDEPAAKPDKDKKDNDKKELKQRKHQNEDQGQHRKINAPENRAGRD